MDSTIDPMASRALLLVKALDLRRDCGRALSPDEYSSLHHSAFAGTLEILVDRLARPIGYISWACVNKASAQRLLRYGKYPRYAYEWNEGVICMILDILIIGSARCE